MLYLWLLMALWFYPSIDVRFGLCYDQHFCLLMGFIFAFLLSLSMVSGHKVKALWPMASPMTLLYATCYGLTFSALPWNCRLTNHIVVSLRTSRISSSHVRMVWSTGSCIHL